MVRPVERQRHHRLNLAVTGADRTGNVSSRRRATICCFRSEKRREARLRLVRLRRSLPL